MTRNRHWLRSAVCRPVRRYGASLQELLAAVLILGFIVAAVGRLFTVGLAQQGLARNFSQAQTDLRKSLRQSTRTLRHGFAPKGPTTPSTKTNFATNSALSAAYSNASQVIVPIRDTDGMKEVCFYYSGGKIYEQKSDVAAPGTALLTGVTSATFRYFKTSVTTSGAVTTEVASAPETATELEVTAAVERTTATFGKVATSASVYVTLRNAIAGSL